MKKWPDFHINLSFSDFVMFTYCYSVLILPNCGPDMKYFLAFMRTQLSTTTTMILVFGPKVSLSISHLDKIKWHSNIQFGRILAGTGDDTGDKHKRWQLSSMVTILLSQIDCHPLGSKSMYLLFLGWCPNKFNKSNGCVSRKWRVERGTTKTCC